MIENIKKTKIILKIQIYLKLIDIFILNLFKKNSLK